MRKLGLVALTLILFALVCLCSCSSTAQLLERFSLDVPEEQTVTTKILTGSVSYGAGIYFPNSNDLLDISLLKTDATTGTIQEISHQRIRNIQKFPLQFSLRYEKSDISEGDTCSLLVSLTVDGVVKAQGMVQLEAEDGNFSESSVILSAISTESKN